MPAMRSRMRERFCLFIAEGMRVVEAAKQAGYQQPNVRGSELLAQPQIVARIEELGKILDVEKVKAHVQATAPTRDYVLRELVDNVSSAKAASDRSSVNKGLELIGREIGMFVNRTMNIESPLQRLPADKLVSLLQLVDDAIGTNGQTVAGSVPNRKAPPMIEATAEPGGDEQW